MTHIENVIVSDLYLHGLGKLSISPVKAWAITEHKCPRCNKAVTDPIEWEFMVARGICLGCDHVEGDR